MTFYEAALQILQREGKPLHASEITELAVRDNLLSHVGKQPEVTMASRLAAMARRSQDRRLVAVEPDIFGLTDWGMPASSEALDQSGLPEEHDEEEPPLRGRERHPKIDKENVRVAGRSDRRRKYEEAEKRKKKKKRRPLSLPELVFEILELCGRPVSSFELAAAIREHDLHPDDIGREALEKALKDENGKRLEEERSEAFAFYAGGKVGLVEGPEPVEDGVDEVALVASAVEKIVGERKPVEAAAPAPVAEAAQVSSVDAWVAEQRQRAIRQVRQALLALETPALESLTQNLFDLLGYRDVRIAKRHKDGCLFTCRRRMGLTEVRFAVRIVRGGKDVRREDVIELRKDMGSHSAQLGVIVSPSDVTREGRNEVGQPGQPLVTLLTGDALVEQMLERGLGVSTQTVTVVQFDDDSLRKLVGQVPAQVEGQPTPRSSAAERRERRDKERREWRERREKEREERRRLRAAEAAARAQAGTEEADKTSAEAGGDLIGAEVPVTNLTGRTVGAEEPILDGSTGILGAESPILDEGMEDAEAAEPGIALAGAFAEEGEAEFDEEGDEATGEEEEQGATAPRSRRPRRRRRGRSAGAAGLAAAEPATAETAAAEPAAAEPAAAEPAAAEPEAAEPAAAEPAAAEPEAAEPAAEEPAAEEPAAAETSTRVDPAD